MKYVFFTAIGLVAVMLCVSAGMYIFIYTSLIPPAKAAVEGIRIKAEAEGDHWQTEAETRELGTGDCEDFALLIGNAYRQKDIPFSFCALPSRNGIHIVLKVGGFYIDSLRPKLIRITDRNQPKYTWTYEQYQRKL